MVRSFIRTGARDDSALGRPFVKRWEPGAFARRLEDIPAARSRPGDESTLADRRLATATTWTLLDSIQQLVRSGTAHSRGLRGGRTSAVFSPGPADTGRLPARGAGSPGPSQSQGRATGTSTTGSVGTSSSAPPASPRHAPRPRALVPRESGSHPGPRNDRRSAHRCAAAVVLISRSPRQPTRKSVDQGTRIKTCACSNEKRNWPRCPSTPRRHARGHGRLVLVAGEAGVGKSSLLESSRAGASRRPAGRGVPATGCSRRGRWRPSWTSRTARRRAGRAARAGARRTGCSRRCWPSSRTPDVPTVLVIEDVHWADEATLDLVRFLGRRIRDARALIWSPTATTAWPPTTRCGSPSASSPPSARPGG